MNLITRFLKISVLSVILSLIIILLAGIITGTIYAQTQSGSVSGSVIDKTNNSPLEAADVTIQRQRDSSLVKGTSTNSDGRFTITEIPYGRYFIKANVVGYNFATVSGIIINQDNKTVTLEPIGLTSGTTTTEEIVVEGEKSLIEFKPDKKIFNVSKNMTTQGSSLIDLLREVPSVTVDQDGNVSLRGSEGVKIMIDGRHFGLEGQSRNIILEQIPASDVESIELITNPSAKYEAEGSAGIINVILKKQKQHGLGYNGNLALNLATGDKYGGQISLNLKKDKVNIYGNYSYNIRNFTMSGFNERFYLDNPSISQISQDNTGRGRNKSHLIKLGMDYAIDQKNTLGFSFNYRNSDRLRGNTSINKEYDRSNNLVSDYFTTSNDIDKDYSFDINANYLLRFKIPQQTLSADLSFSRDSDDETEENYDTYISPVNNTPDKRNEYSKEIDDALTGKIDYVHPFSKDIKLETGYRGSYKKRDIDFRVENYDYSLNQFVTDFTQSNRFIYKEQIHAAYGIYTQQLGSFGFSLGLRAEQTFINGELQNTSQFYDRNYIDFFPSASLSQKLTKSTEIQLSYSRRVNRPRHRQLNPFISYWGPNNYSQGNPNLNPEFTDSYEFNLIQYFPWATITPGIFYRYTKDEISRQRSLLDSITTLTTFVNLNSSKAYGGELILSLQPVKILSINGTFSYFRTEVDATNLQSGLTNAASTWSARGLTTINLPADFSLQASYFYTGKRVTSNGTIDPFQSFDAALKKDLFDKKLSIALRASDIFNTAKFVVNIDDAYFREYFERVRDSRGLYLNISYKFGQEERKQSSKRKRENNQNEEDTDFDF
ncbi:MAG: TonB-dependent receptor [Chlorobi bacterium]|nr:TonB-dependent receptor [Chlorobiota bacterium]MCI0716714.1 TonB-dependent receptor [Chlorobiota bacterium]